MESLVIAATEFVAVVSHCIDRQMGQVVNKGCKYAVPKATVCRFLNKNAYDRADAKLSLWKQLRWIDGDGKYNTRRVYLPGNDTRLRMVCIDLTVYETLKSFTESTTSKNALLPHSE